jgi:hypothetical protein
MKKAIITTTINGPTKALLKFLEIAERDDWHLFVVADKKTPEIEWAETGVIAHERVHYLSPDDQEWQVDHELSDLIGWNCIQRRNFGFIAAYKWGAEIFATVDDDNIPYDGWGQDLLIGNDVYLEVYDNPGPVYNPLARHDFGYKLVNMCNDPEASYVLWHRGVPEQQLSAVNRMKTNVPVDIEKRHILVQADMWNGDPDISAVCRMVLHPDVKFNHEKPYAGFKHGPFNSQNTFLHRSVMRDYFMFPGIGRMDDIWASYYLQGKHRNSVAYGLATVYQERNPHDLSKDLKAEQIGYEHSLDFYHHMEQGPDAFHTPFPDYMPEQSIKAFRRYQEILDGIHPEIAEE